MNYTRRPNRPDGNVYREMRRRGLRDGRGRVGPLPISPKVLLIVALVVVVLVAWLMWR